MLTNEEFKGLFYISEVEHLPRDESDHAPLFLSYDNSIHKGKRAFKFLKFLTEHENFKEVVKRNFNSVRLDNPFLDLKKKIKQVKKALLVWSKETDGIFFSSY